MSHGAEVEVPHEANDPFTKKVALSVAILAVCLSIVGALDKKTRDDMLFAQLDSANQFSRYQAKAQREVMYVQERESLEEAMGEIPKEQLDSLAKAYSEAQKDRSKVPAEPTERRKQRLAYVVKKLDEYKVEKADLEKEGNNFIAIRKVSHRKGGYFEYAELLMQISIVLASVAILSKTRWFFVLSLLLALVALALLACGLVIPDQFPQVHIPFIDPAHEIAGAEAKH